MNRQLTVRLSKGNVVCAGRRSPCSLYNPRISTFGEGSGYDQADAAGFIRLLGLPLEAELHRGAAGAEAAVTAAKGAQGGAPKRKAGASLSVPTEART